MGRFLGRLRSALALARSEPSAPPGERSAKSFLRRFRSVFREISGENRVFTSFFLASFPKVFWFGFYKHRGITGGEVKMVRRTDLSVCGG